MAKAAAGPAVSPGCCEAALRRQAVRLSVAQTVAKFLSYLAKMIATKSRRDDGAEMDVADQLAPPLDRALAYWQSKRGARTMPSRQDLDPVEMVSFLPNVVLIDVLDGGRDFRYRLIGTNVDDLLQESCTGRSLSEFPERDAAIRESCGRAFATGQPVSRSLAYRGPGEHHVEIQQITLPLSADGRSVNTLMVVITHLPK
jgi:hypothetical protein